MRNTKAIYFRLMEMHEMVNLGLYREFSNNKFKV